MSCTSCEGIGYRFVYPKNWQEHGRGSVVFRCACSFGRSKSSTGIPLWRDELLSRFQLDAHKSIESDETEEVQAEVAIEAPKTPIARFSESDKEFIRAIRVSKEWSHPRFKELLELHGKDRMKAALLGGV